MEKNGIDSYLQKFEYFEKEAKQPSWVFPLRKAGIARFAELGFPTIKQEDWRFTNVAAISKLPFKPMFDSQRNGLSSDQIQQFTFGKLASSRLVFVNGHFVADLSSPGKLPNGIILQSLSSALASDSTILQQHLSRYANIEDNA